MTDPDPEPSELLARTGWVRRLARALVLDPAQADDVVQDAWLVVATEPRVAARAEALPDAAALVQAAEQQTRVVRAVLELDEPYRSTLLLRFWEELSAEEIARRLGVPSSTVRKSVHRALASLRERFYAEAGGDRRSWSLALLPLSLPSEGARAAASAAVATAGDADEVVVDLP